jgi:hypothetical protein
MSHERPCAFTGRPATAKMRFPEDDPHTWFEVPCCKHYLKLRNEVGSEISRKLRDFEEYMAVHFMNKEMSRALPGYVSDPGELPPSFHYANRLIVETEMAKRQAEHDAEVEANLDKIADDRLGQE